MIEAWLSLLIGVGISVASAAILWFCAKQCRLARSPSIWAGEGLATTLSLALVSLIVVGGAWTIKGAMFLVPDAIVGLVVGFLIVIVAMFVTLRILGKLPDDDSTPQDLSAVGQPRSQTARARETA
jgi:divalent metal cation (Fe/Co/Zn/Cd) transporter